METALAFGGTKDGSAGSYRTYEEWKPSPVLPSTSFVFCSYRTYEEWKHAGEKEYTKARKVLTVPMRNGNLR